MDIKNDWQSFPLGGGTNLELDLENGMVRINGCSPQKLAPVAAKMLAALLTSNRALSLRELAEKGGLGAQVGRVYQQIHFIKAALAGQRWRVQSIGRQGRYFFDRTSPCSTAVENREPRRLPGWLRNALALSEQLDEDAIRRLVETHGAGKNAGARLRILRHGSLVIIVLAGAASAGVLIWRHLGNQHEPPAVAITAQPHVVAVVGGAREPDISTAEKRVLEASSIGDADLPSPPGAFTSNGYGYEHTAADDAWQFRVSWTESSDAVHYKVLQWYSKSGPADNSIPSESPKVVSPELDSARREYRWTVINPASGVYKWQVEASNKGGKRRSSGVGAFRVELRHPSALLKCTLTASPVHSRYGQPVTLTWETGGGASRFEVPGDLFIDQESVPGDHSIFLNPKQDVSRGVFHILAGQSNSTTGVAEGPDGPRMIQTITAGVFKDGRERSVRATCAINILIH